MPVRPKNKAMLLLLDQIDTVQCTFDAKYVDGLSRLYTYKCKKGFAKVGDIAVVFQDEKLKFVTVVIVDAKPTFDVTASYDYAWLYAIVDNSVYTSCLEAEQELVNYILASQAQQSELTKGLLGD